MKRWLIAGLLMVSPVLALAEGGSGATGVNGPSDTGGTGSGGLKDLIFGTDKGVPDEKPFTKPDLKTLKQWAPFRVNYTSRQNVFELALDSLALGEDKIIRYAVSVSVKDSKVRNIRYEGIACDNNQYRVYAYGNPDGTWAEAEQTWKPVLVSQTRNAYQGALYDEFCGLTGVKKVADIVKGFDADVKATPTRGEGGNGK
ncbi:CNP1-like family protein [Andreprevotia chitinilytica]|uniref:CNP1-like family protein n=1 Tax=Andreprevotia chitinilytica TaxID=396808 RepID=UPI000553F6EC|nr:CNP1-like family protein [Andreprevotia chitinilytica]